MALDATIIGRILTSALSHLSDRSGEHRPYQLALKLNAKYNLSPEAYGFTSEQGLFNAVWNVVKSANASHAVGANIQRTVDEVFTPPKIPGFDEFQPRYFYRVAAEIRLPDGSRLTTALVIRDDNALSFNQLQSEAMQQLANTVPQWGDTPGRGRIRDEMGSYPVSIYVIAAGRRD